MTAIASRSRAWCARSLRIPSPNSGCRRHERSPPRRTRSSSPTPSVFTPGARAPRRPRGSRSGPSAGATRSCPGPASTPGRSHRSACANRPSTGNRSICSRRWVSGGNAGAPATASRPSIRSRPPHAMDTHTATIAAGLDQGSDAAAGGKRSFLFLQGPISNFFDQHGRALIARGHRVHRINLHFGDQLFWRLPATHYRGRFEDWRAFIANALEEHEVTDLIVHGDRRLYHVVAAEEARAREITVLSTDLGYVRPDWVTLEHDGLSTYSRFPREPHAIRALADQFLPPDLMPRFHAPFRLVAALDVIYNLGLVFGRPLYPNYRYHGIFHPFTEYAGWIASRAKLLFTRAGIVAEKQRLQTASGSYFLFPLQLATDFQLRAHSPFTEAHEALRQVIGSFAASGSERKLVCIVHPLDPGITSWHRKISTLAREFGVSQQVQVLEGGTPHDLLVNAAGVVTINSTIGITALHHGVPVKVLGNAIFDVPGLTCQESLDAFWNNPSPPDSELMAAFVRALCGATQIKGGYYDPASKACALAGFVERLEQGPHPLPVLTAADFAGRPVRPANRHIVLADISDGITLALARAYAAPGVKL